MRGIWSGCAGPQAVEATVPEFLLLYTTWPDAEKAAVAGRAAVEARLAACANVFAPIRSIYRWEDRIEEAAEVAMTLKTTAQAAPALRALLLARHPYDLPCIVAMPLDAAASHADFLAWIRVETNSSTSPGKAQ